MSDVARIRSFLIQHPKPSIVRVTGDGEPQDVRVGKSYQRCAETVAALEPERIELFDAEKQLLRAMSLADEESRRSDAASIPAGIAGDPNALMLTHFANLLHRAYEHSTEIAFAKLVDLTERLNDRSEAVEQRLERAEAQYRKLAQDQIESALDRAEEAQSSASGSMEQQMIGAFLGGRSEAPAARKTSNGKGHD
jgi:hypothetical protein